MGRGNDYRDNRRGRGDAPDPWASDRQPSFGDRRASSSYDDRQSRPRSGPALSSGPETEARVKWFNAEKGFGFVEVGNGSGDAFLHVSVLQRAGADSVNPGANLRVRVGPGQKGQQVTEVLEIKEGDAPPPSPRGGDRGDRGPRPSYAPSGDGEEMRGTVKWYNAQKGFGFVTPESGGKDVFVHATALERSGMQPLAEGQTVTMMVVQGRKGPEAATVRSG